MRDHGRGRAGFSVLELLISVTFLVVITFAVTLTMRSVQGTHDRTAAVAQLESRGHRVVDRILAPLRAADGGTIWPASVPPASSDGLQFQRLELQPDGTVAPTATERIQLDPATGEVVWTRDVGLPDERAVVLCQGVPATLEGEDLNLADDNGNGLEDEPGLCFSFEGDLLVVRLTLTADGPDGAQLVRTFQGRVFRRN